MKRICWYARDGHLDFFARLSKRLQETGSELCSSYVCNTTVEKMRLQKEYQITAEVLEDDFEKSFFPSQDLCKEIHRIEKLYPSVPLRKLLWAEQYLRHFSEEEMMRHLVVLFHFWERILSEHQVEGVVSERPGILPTCVLWLICKHRSIAFIDFVNLGIDGQIQFSSSWNGHIDGFAAAYATTIMDRNRLEYKKAVTYLHKMNTSPQKPAYIFRNLTTGENFGGERIFRQKPKLTHVGRLYEKLSLLKRVYPYENHAEFLHNLALFEIRSFLHRFFSLFEKDVLGLNERYFLYPLQISDEWTNFPIMGLVYPHGVTLIDQISSCLPLGAKLYVKEHTSGFPSRSFREYRTLKRIPRVRLIDRYENSFQLIKNSSGVITLGGSMGWEAFLLGKPLFLLGEAWYSHLPGIYKINNFNELIEAFSAYETLSVASEEEKLKAIYTLYMIGFEAVRYPINELITKENIEKFLPSFRDWLSQESLRDG